jgi:hypothetical protein
MPPLRGKLLPQQFGRAIVNEVYQAWQLPRPASNWVALSRSPRLRQAVRWADSRSDPGGSMRVRFAFLPGLPRVRAMPDEFQINVALWQPRTQRIGSASRKRFLGRRRFRILLVRPGLSDCFG